MNRTTLKYQKSTGYLFDGKKKVGEAIIKDSAMFCHFYDDDIYEVGNFELIE